jgi:8-amino-7-oxononanoate synthase
MRERPERALEALARRGLLRRLQPRAGTDFTSNDYLGLAQSPELIQAAEAALLRGVAIGAGGSRLLRGNDPEHEALEAEAAQYFGAEAALYFGGGFTANTAIFASLPAHGDAIFHDALIHASVHDGIRLSKAAAFAFAHNDANALEDALRAWRTRGNTGTPWIAVESLYSMDGDCAPLGDLAVIAGRYEAMLVIDEAHATGVLGPQGRGLGTYLEGRENVISLHTCGKALGASGALVLGSRGIREFLVNRARPFIYATAPSPLMAVVVRSALHISKNSDDRRAALASRVSFAGEALRAIGCNDITGTHIQPVIVGAEAHAVDLADSIQAAGFDVRAIRPPTVPAGTARLRLSLTLNATQADIGAMITVLAAARERLAA